MRNEIFISHNMRYEIFTFCNAKNEIFTLGNARNEIFTFEHLSPQQRREIRQFPCCFPALLLLANGSRTLDYATSNGRSSAAERPKLLKFGV